MLRRRDFCVGVFWAIASAARLYLWDLAQESAGLHTKGENMALTPDQEKPFNDLKAARAEQGKRRVALEKAEETVETESTALEQAREDEEEALKLIKKIVAPLKKGEDKFLTTSDGTQWHVENEGRRLRVEQVKGRG